MTSTANRVRRGLLGEKVGMTQTWDDSNRVVPVTVLRVGPCVVTRVRRQEVDGYAAVQLGYGAVDPRKVTKPAAGQFAQAGVTPRRHVAELRTTDAEDYSVGQELGPDIFSPGELVDVTGTSKGHGFAGVMKRHGFAGQRASHGAHRVHRAPGSIGGCATPARVFKGVRMPGRLGGVRVSAQSLTVHAVDPDRGLLLVRGSVPGPRGGVVLVRSAVRGPEVPARSTAQPEGAPA